MSLTEPPKTYRVLIENPMLPPYRLDLFKALTASSKLDITLSFGLAYRKTALKDVLGIHGLDTLPVRNVYMGPNGATTFQMGLIKHLKAEKWDAMIASFDPRLVFNIIAILVARRRGIRFIWWGHGIRPRQRYRWLYKRLAMAADAVILYNQTGRRQLVELGVPSNKLFVAWNAIDTDVIATLRKKEWTGRNRILSIGRLVRGKRVDILLDAFAKIIGDVGSNIRLSIIGEGPELEALRIRSISLGIEGQVDWHGALYDNADLAPIFNSSLVSVTSGYVGLSAIHSLAFGVPLVFADNEPHSPEVEALVPGVNSITFSAKDAGSLAQVLISLIKEPSLPESLGDAGAEMVSKEFSVARMVETFEEVIEFACKSS